MCMEKTEEDEQYETKGVGEQVFEKFTKELLDMNIFKQRNKYFFFIMDNVNFHKSSPINNLYNRRDLYKLLPPYSPFLNPIENVFGIWKSIYRNMKYRSDSEVEVAILDPAKQLKLKSRAFLRCFEHTHKYYDTILSVEDMEG